MSFHFMLIKWFYADEFSGSRIRDVAELEAKYGIKDPAMLKVAGFILFLVIINFFLHPITHIAVSWIALVGAVVMLLATDRHELEEPLHHVEWTTLLFLRRLFVLVHSLQYMGVIAFIGTYVEKAIAAFGRQHHRRSNRRLAAAILIVLWVSAVASAFIDNIPYTATMIPIVCRLLTVWETTFLAVDLGIGLWRMFGWKRHADRCISQRCHRRHVRGCRLSDFLQRVLQGRFPMMILTTFIVSLYMLLVFVVGGEDNATFMKLILVGITTLSIIINSPWTQQGQKLRRIPCR